MSQPPAFQFYASDYLSSSKVQRMSLEAEGAYVRLLAYNWQDGYIPADIDKLARMCKTTPRKMTALWTEYLQDCFVLVDSDPGKYINIRLEEVRQQLADFKESRSRAGKFGNEKRWGDRKAIAKRSHSDEDATRKTIANDRSSSPSSVIPPISPPAGDKFVYPPDFETFWQAYPEKSGKRAAFAVWKQLRPSPELLSKMLKTLEWQRVSEDWTKENGKYIPDPERWLKKGKWDDEPTAAAKVQRKVPSIYEAL